MKKIGKLTRKGIKILHEDVEKKLSDKELKYYQSYWDDDFKNYQAKTLAKKFPKWFLYELYLKKSHNGYMEYDIHTENPDEDVYNYTEMAYAKEIISIDKRIHNKKTKTKTKSTKTKPTPKPRKKPKTFLTLTGGEWIECITWGALFALVAIVIILAQA